MTFRLRESRCNKVYCHAERRLCEVKHLAFTLTMEYKIPLSAKPTLPMTYR